MPLKNKKTNVQTIKFKCPQFRGKLDNHHYTNQPVELRV